MKFLGDLIIHGILWSFLPQLVTKILLHHFYYRFRSGERPDKSSAKYKYHYRNAFIMVIFCYISGSLINSIKNMPLNLYQELGIHRMDVENDLKNFYRQLAKTYHPDKSTPSMTSGYLKKKEIYEVLSDKNLKKLYDDFGPSILSTARQFSLTKSKLRDILYSGLIEIGLFYLASILLMVISKSNGTFWRFLLLISGITIELIIVLRVPWSFDGDWWKGGLSLVPYSLYRLIGSMAIFEYLQIFRQILLLIGLAINQLYPLIIEDEKRRENQLPSIEKMVQSLYQDSEELKRETEEVIQSEINLIKSNDKEKMILERYKEMLERNRIENALENAQKQGVLPKKDKTA